MKIWNTICEIVEFLKMDFSLKTKGYYVEHTKSSKRKEKPLFEVNSEDADKLREYGDILAFTNIGS